MPILSHQTQDLNTDPRQLLLRHSGSAHYRRIVTFIYRRLRNILTYLLTYLLTYYDNLYSPLDSSNALINLKYTKYTNTDIQCQVKAVSFQCYPNNIPVKT